MKGHRLVTLLLLVVLVLGSVSSTLAAPRIDTSELRAAVTLAGVRAHQAELQAIADANNDTRASGTPGYDDSADYVADALTAAGYNVTTQPFDFAFFQELADPVMERVSPDPKSYVAGTDMFTMEYSASGDVTAPVQAVDVQIPPGAAANSSTSGCEASDFTDFISGNIALVQRGTCTFAQKVENAQAAGAVGVIVFNEGQAGRTDAFIGTLGGPVATVPVVGASFAVGEELAGSSAVVRLATFTTSETRTTTNVLAETPGGRGDRVVVVGAHLDSVPEGPGINDNGSGTAAILEIALQMAALGIEPENKVRFAFWGAEESGLIGSEFYVSQLSKRDIKNIALNLNFDMLGSPNFVRFVYDGDGSATPLAGPNGSKVIEKVFLDYFGEQGLATAPTAFDGRSDYGPFIAVGIPAGGLFSGAEGIKTPEQAAVYGGTAGLAYDPCYHQACDTFDNVSETGLDQLTDAAAHAVLTFAMTQSAVNGTDKGKANGQFKDLEFDGSHLRR